MIGRRAAGALGLAWLAGCSSSPNPVLYTIASVPGATHAGGPAVIVLRRIGLSKYLERQPIVRSSEGYRLDVSQNDWWGEPLAAMVARLLVDELGQRLPGSTILSDTGALTAAADATVELNIERLDEDRSGSVVLSAQAGIEFKGARAPALRAFRIAVPATGTDVGAEVAAISSAVGQLADGLAAMLTASPVG